MEGRQSTPLHFAAGFNRVEVVEFLLSMGADVQAKDKGGLVPLHNACSYGHLEVVVSLVTHGANVNAPDLWKFTPLHESAAKGIHGFNFFFYFSCKTEDQTEIFKDLKGLIDKCF